MGAERIFKEVKKEFRLFYEVNGFKKL